ncbi:hypothetical protein ACU8V7_23945 [Zobellia nedashkovskayae]
MVYFTGSDWCPPCKKLKQDLLRQRSSLNYQKVMSYYM